MRECDITTNAYNAAATPANATATNAMILIIRRCSNAYNASANIRSRDATNATTANKAPMQQCL